MATYATLAALNLDANISVFSRCGLCLYPASSFDTEIVVSKIYDKISPVTLLNWDLSKYNPNIITISLGTNDELGNQFTKDGFKDACSIFLNNLEKIYHKDLIFIFTYGYMNKNNDVEQALIKLRGENLNKRIFLLKMPQAKIGHPTVEEHKVGALLLTSLIEEIMKLN